MPGEFYFMAVGGLGVTLAGFAGLIAALQGPEGQVASWRIRNVVYQGFGVTLVGFATVALYSVTQDIALTVRLASLVMVISMVARWGEMRPGPAWPNDRQRRGYLVGWLAFAIVVTVNIGVASVGYLQLLLLFALGAPAGVFARAVREVTRQTDAGSGSELPSDSSGRSESPRS
jgi:hypothetical protein